MSPVDYYSTHSIEMHFTTVPARGLPRGGSVPRDELTIRRDPTSSPAPQIPAMVFMEPSDEKYLV
jgi:hypothetical protein